CDAVCCRARLAPTMALKVAVGEVADASAVLSALAVEATTEPIALAAALDRPAPAASVAAPEALVRLTLPPAAIVEAIVV
ncbi:hypothetical protein ABTL90_19690, partial [Acinetobacter baumannii]